MSIAKQDKLHRYKMALAINATVGLIQVITLSFIAKSLSLFGDTSHSIADVFILAGTVIVLRRELIDPSHHHEGAKRTLVFVAIFLLFISAVYIVWEALGRIAHPVYFPGWPVVLMALLSAGGNFVAHRMIADIDSAEHDATHEANLAHILTDLALSLIVLVSALGNILFATPAIDTWLSLVVAGWMIWWSIKIFKSVSSSHAHTHHH
jgi:cobalt-zinc-cadmium efflux system protein